MRNTLGLDDDLDPNELQDALELSFGLQFSGSEAASCRTVDDIFQMIRGHFSPTSEKFVGCATAMAFYRLKKALSGLRICFSLTPDTKMGALLGWPVRRHLAELGRRSGLRVPRCKATLLGYIGGLMIPAGLVWFWATAVVAPAWWPTGLIIGVLGFGLLCIDPGRLPSDCRTLGGLARRMAGLNFGELHARGAKPRDTELWDALLEVLAECTTLPKAEIRADTLILHSDLQSAQNSLALPDGRS